MVCAVGRRCWNTEPINTILTAIDQKETSKVSEGINCNYDDCKAPNFAAEPDIQIIKYIVCLHVFFLPSSYDFEMVVISTIFL